MPLMAVDDVSGVMPLVAEVPEIRKVCQVDEPDAGENEDRSQDQGSDNPPKQHAVVVFTGDVEITEDEDKDEEIIDRERLFDPVSGLELGKGLGISTPVKEGAESHGKADPNHGPNTGLLGGDNVAFFVKNAEVKRQHQEYDHPKYDNDHRMGHQFFMMTDARSSLRECLG